jgi:hypothetical protein
MPVGEQLQSMINSLEEGLPARVLRLFIFVFLAVAAFCLYAWSQHRGLKEPQAMEHAALARNLAEGRGFVTRCIRPADAWFLRQHRRLPDDASAAIPDVRNAPLYPAVLAAGFRLSATPFRLADDAPRFLPERRVIIALGIVLSVITAGLVFALGRSLFDARVGMFAAVTYVVTDRALALAVSGLPSTLGVPLITAALLLAVAAVRRRGEDAPLARSAAPFVAAALCAGLAVLTDYSLLIPTLAIGLFLALRTERWRWTTAILFVGLALLVALPWFIRNTSVTGAPLGISPYAALRDTALFEADAFDRSPEPIISSVRATHAVHAKLIHNLPRVLDGGLATMANGLVMAFFVLAFFQTCDRAEANSVRWYALAAILGLSLVAALGGDAAAGRFALLLPVVVVLATGCFLSLIERWGFVDPTWQNVFASLFIALAGMTAATRVAGTRGSPAYPPYYPPLQAYVGSLVAPDETLCTDIPWATAWYGGCRSVLLPNRLAELEPLTEALGPVAGIYLTQQTADAPYDSRLRSGPDRDWLPLLNRTVPQDFPYRHAVELPPGRPDQLFLTDGTRWETPESPPANRPKKTL